MYYLHLLGAMALVSRAAAEVTTVWATVTEAPDTGVKVLNTTSAAATSAAASSAQPTITTTFNAAQTTLYYEEVNSYLTGSAYAALGSELATELPESIYTKENSIGFAGLSTEYGSSFTLQSWYSDVIAVHTQVESALESIVDDIATKLVNATFTSTTPTAIRTPTTAAATVTQASSTFATTTGLVAASGGPSGTAGTAAASQQSTAAAAQVTAAVQNVLGYGAVAVGGIVGALML